MAIVADRSGNNPGNPITNGWSGLDAHSSTTEELERHFYANGTPSTFSLSLFPLTTLLTWQAALGINDAASVTTGVLNAARIPNLDASKITTGVFSAALIPVMFSSVQVISTSATIAGLSAGDQAAIVQGCILTLTDGTRWTYSGTGLKTSSGSYIQLADVTPDWSVLTGKPTFVGGPSTAVPQQPVNSQTGTAGSGTLAPADDHAHPYPNANINAQVGTTYTLVATDHGKVVELTNAGAITVTLPNSLPIGFNCSLYQGGAGQVTLSTAAGATLRSSVAGTKTRVQYSEVALRIRTNGGGNTAEYVASGDII